jgi:hypothetical protein
MQSNQKWKIFGIVLAFFCLICLVITFIGYLYLSDQPPSTVTSNSGYYIRRTKVFYLGGFPSTAVEIYGADVNTFQIIDSVYAKDKSNVYFNGFVIPDSDPATFELLGTWFSRDKNHVYVSGQIFTDDPENFEIIDGNIYIDSQHIYWSTTIISDDPQNLVVIGSFGFYTYFKDSQTVFVNGNAINGADLNTFEVINEGYSRDAENAFYFDELIPDADVESFEALEQQYAKDAAFAYWMGEPIPGSDPATFIVLNADFECTADATHAYYQDQQIQGFDPNSIPAGAHVNNCDLSTVYFTP